MSRERELLKQALNEIEYKIAHGEISAAQVFTSMKQFIDEPRPEQAPLSNERIINEGWHECRKNLPETIFHSEIFMMGVEWAEKAHGIGK